MHRGLAAAARAAQTYVPWALPTKVTLQRVARRTLRRPFERDFRALRLLDLDPKGTFVDIGGNRGQSIDAIRLYLPRARVISYEPNPVLAEWLISHFRHDPTVMVRQLALGDAPGQFTLYIPTYNGFLFDGLASFDKENPHRWLSTNILGFRESRYRLDEVRCTIKRLDDEDLDPVFLKIDIQGYEHAALLGGMSTLERAKPAVLIETPSPPVVDLMTSLGYRHYLFDGQALVPDTLGTLNTYFLTSSHIRS